MQEVWREKEVQGIDRNNQGPETPQESMRVAEEDHLRLGQPWEHPLALLNASNQLLKESILARGGRTSLGSVAGLGACPHLGRPLKKHRGFFVRKQEQGTILAGSVLP